MARWLMSLARTLLRPLWLAVLLVVCLAAGGASYYFWSAAATDDLKRQALAAMDDREFNGARTLLQAYTTARPNDGEAHFLLARTFRRARVEDLDQAHLQLDEARKLRFSGPDLELEAALVDVQETGSPINRGDTLRQALASGGTKQALALEALARGCIAQNRLDDANGYLNQWVELAPDDWYPRLWRGALFEYTSQAHFAVADFDFVRGKRPADEAIRMRLGLMLSQSGLDYKESLKYLEPYDRAHPGDVDVIVGIARCRRMLQQTDEAEALLKPVVAAHPDHIDALVTLAQVESDRGENAEALDLLRRVEPLIQQTRGQSLLERLRRLELTPNHMDIPYRMQVVYTLNATVLGRLGRMGEAQRYRGEADQISADADALAKAIQEHHEKPHDVAVLEKVGLLYMRLGIVTEGVDALERVLQQKADDVPAHKALAEYYGSRDDPESQRLAALHRQYAGAAAPPSPSPQGP